LAVGACLVADVRSVNQEVVVESVVLAGRAGGGRGAKAGGAPSPAVLTSVTSNLAILVGRTQHRASSTAQKIGHPVDGLARLASAIGRAGRTGKIAGFALQMSHILILPSIARGRASVLHRQLQKIVDRRHRHALGAGTQPTPETQLATTCTDQALPARCVCVVPAGADREAGVVEEVVVYAAGRGGAVLGGAGAGYAGRGTGLAEIGDAGVDELPGGTGSRTGSRANVLVVLRCADVGAS
jgi:hypothetical protein